MTTFLLVLARTLHLGSAMLMVAFPIFALVVLRPAVVPDSLAGDAVFYRRTVKWLWLAWLMEAASGFVWFWLVTAQMNDQSPRDVLDFTDFSTVLVQTQFGQLWLLRGLAGITLGLVLYRLSRRKQRTPLGDWLLLVISSALLLSLAWSGHAAAGVHFYVLHVVADASHLLVGAIWPIGLIPLFCFLWPGSQVNRVAPANREIAILQRFSQISLLAVLIMVLTGILNSWLMLGSWEALVTTTYGELLLAKILVVGFMISLGALNRFYLLPRLPTDSSCSRKLRNVVLAESFLALVVLLLVGAMGMTAPPS